MNIDYADALKKGLRFCIQPKRWLPVFIIDLSFFSVALAVILANMPYLIYFVASIEEMTVLEQVASFLVSIFAIFIAWIFVSIWVNGALIHQSNKEREFRKSWGFAGRKYLSMLGVSAITGIVAFLVGLVTYVGWVFSIVVSLALFFSMQGVIVKESGFIKAMEDSWHIFKRQPFKVFLMLILISAISLLIIAVFAMPLLALLSNILLDILKTGTLNVATFISIVFALENQLPMFVVLSVILLLGTALARVFTLKAQTEFYNQIKEKHHK